MENGLKPPWGEILNAKGEVNSILLPNTTTKGLLFIYIYKHIIIIQFG